MSVPVGTWNVVTDLNNSILNIINVDGQGNVTGTIQASDISNIIGTWNITGTWNAATNQLNFSYVISITIGILREWRNVSFQGYLFQAGKPLFESAAGPVTAAWDMLAGTWGSVPPWPEQTNNGWVARSQNQL